MVNPNENTASADHEANPGPGYLARAIREVLQIGNLTVTVTQLMQKSSEFIENGRLDKALAPLMEALTLCESSLPSNHPQTLEVLRQYVRVLILQERFVMAERIMQKNIAALRQDRGTDPLDLVLSLSIMFEINRGMEKFSDAKNCLEESISLLEKEDSFSDNDILANMLGNLFLMQLKCEQIQSAKETLLKALGIREQQDAEHPDIAYIKMYIQDMDDLLS